MDKTALYNSIAGNVVFTFSRSSGAGGQNVNKVNTKVHAAVGICALAGLTERETLEIRRRLAGHINQNDAVFIYVQDERTQERNREIAVDRLSAKIAAAAKIPAKRKRTKPSAAMKERRLQAKRIRSLQKRERAFTEKP